MDSVNNEEQFMALYEEYFRKIYNYILRHVMHRETAEDLTGNVFMNALAAVKNGGITVNNFSAWIYRIATNELFSHHKKKRGKRTLSMDDETLRLYDVVVDEKNHNEQELADFLTMKKSLEKLPAAESLVIEMHFYESKDYGEMAEILGCKEVTVRSKVCRALKKLKRLCGYKAERT